MKRDMDMVRNILLEIRNCPDNHWINNDRAKEDRMRGFHLHIMVEGGLLYRIDLNGEGIEGYTTTPEGLEFAELIANDDVWKHAKRAIEHRLLGSAPYEIWKEVCLQMARGRIRVFG